MKSFLREPLVHFLALGAALFLYFHWSGGAGAGSGRIVLTSGQIDHLAAGFAKVWQRPPTEAELKGLVDDWVREEIAVREATAAGLDRDDTIVRRRLRQKLEFVAEDVAAAVPPTEAELQAWLDAHPDAFRREPETAFEQIYFREERSARAALEAVRRGGDRERFGDPTLLPAEMERSARAVVASVFGPEFAAAVESLPEGAWSGPIASSYGWHLVFVRERIAGSLPALPGIRAEVEREFLADRRVRQLDGMYERLLRKYTVVVEKRELRP
ncbi:MAG TPA: peptidylprolyl isomerase [Candidatus Polarisedimenticolaceae bacterium]